MKNVEKLITIRDNLLSNPNSRPSTSGDISPQSRQNSVEITTKQSVDTPRVIKNEKILYFDFEKFLNVKNKSDEQQQTN